MTHEISDMLEVLLIAKEVRLWKQAEHCRGRFQEVMLGYSDS